MSFRVHSRYSNPASIIEKYLQTLLPVMMRKILNIKAVLLLLLFLALLMIIKPWIQLLLLPRVKVEKAIMNDTLVSSARLMMASNRAEFQGEKSKPLLLLFTSFQPKLTQFLIHHNTIKCWGFLRPFVQPLLYYDSDLDSETEESLRKNGWLTRKVPRSYENLPTVKHMFLDAIKAVPAHYYGFANSDILFDESLFLTLWALHHNTSVKDFFLTGRRINFPMRVEDYMGGLEDIRTMASNDFAEIFIKEAMDYFIVSKNGFPWNKLPNFVISKRGYDNYLMTDALLHSTMVIDATNSLLSVHQSAGQNDYASHFGDLAEVNMDLIPKNYSMSIGYTDCARWETWFNYRTKTVVLGKRPKNRCSPNYAQYGLPEE